MSGRLPSVKPGEVVRALERAGWVVDRQRGSHIALVKDGVSNIVVVVMHNREVPRGLLLATIKDAGLTTAEFRKLL